MNKSTMNQLSALLGAQRQVSYAQHARAPDTPKINGQNWELPGEIQHTSAGPACFALLHPVNKRLIRLGTSPEKAISRAAQIVTKHGKRVPVFQLVPFGTSVPGAVFRKDGT